MQTGCHDLERWNWGWTAGFDSDLRQLPRRRAGGHQMAGHHVVQSLHRKRFRQIAVRPDAESLSRCRLMIEGGHDEDLELRADRPDVLNELVTAGAGQADVDED